MNRPIDLPLAHLHDDDADVNTSGNATFNQVLDARLSRRSILRGGVGTAATAVLGGLSLSACGGSDDPAPAPPVPVAPSAVERLSFAAVPKNVLDQVTVPAGYTATVLFALGDPLAAATPDFKNDGTDNDYDNRAGDHHDGMEYYGLSASGQPDTGANERGLLVINHEATSGGLASVYVHADGGTITLPRPASEIDKEIRLHGVSVIEVRRAANGSVSYVRDSAFNRRITPLTPMEISGPARGNALTRTKYSVDGTQARGTINNCGSGRTPWGTYLAPEENWAGYFFRSDDVAARGGPTAKSVVSLARNRRVPGASRHGWQSGGPDDQYARWDISQTGASVDGTDDYRNELNTFGYAVEIDPYNKAAAIKKRTAMGRFAHESSSYPKPVVGKPLTFYMGDDSQGEYVYKFVTTALWSASDATAADRIAVGDKYLDSGKLYVAKYNDNGTGEWIELAIGNPAVANNPTYAFADAGDVAINTRLAADAVGATRMDRPEWCAVHPTTGEVYFTMTNNSSRRLEPTATQMGLDAANPRAYQDPQTDPVRINAGNVNGHIIRMAEAGGDASATSFTWDVYLFGAEAGADSGKVNLSSLTDDQDFSSPDGLWFSPSTGLCWIQTDDGAYTDVTNCMMLAAVPGQVGDGVKATLSYTRNDGSVVSVDTYVGKKPAPDTLRRFLVGPVDCEITGITETPDGRTMFVNVQHPGETVSKATLADPAQFVSHWPGNAGYGAGGALARPRSATIVITKNDGGRIGA